MKILSFSTSFFTSFFSRFFSRFAFLSSPHYFMRYARRFSILFFILSLIFFIFGVYTGLYASPPDYQQGDSVRIMYVHVPTASLSLLFYTILSFFSLIYFITRIKLADIAALCCAPIGAGVTFIALVTGSLWGQLSWGAFWVWDARLTSTLILFFIYMSYIGLRSMIVGESRSAKIGAVFALIGFVDIPLIKFSVDWWYTLHQPASLIRFDGISIAPSMLLPLFLMSFGLLFFFISMVLVSMQNHIMQRHLKRHIMRDGTFVENIVDV